MAIAARQRGVSFKRALLYASALLVPITLGFIVVGREAPGKGFNWEVASVFGTAVGTTLLAIATLGVAYSTWQDVRASQLIAEDTKTQADAVRRSTELAEREREERLRPIVIGSITGWMSGVSDHLNVDLANIGGGAAVSLEVTVEYVGSDYQLDAEGTLIAWMPSGGSQRVPVRVRGLPLEEEDAYGDARHSQPPVEDFRARGTYLDRYARPVTPPILDWVHDELPRSG